MKIAKEQTFLSGSGPAHLSPGPGWRSPHECPGASDSGGDVVVRDTRSRQRAPSLGSGDPHSLLAEWKRVTETPHTQRASAEPEGPASGGAYLCAGQEKKQKRQEHCAENHAV